MWHVYNLIEPGDRVTSTAVRKVVREGSTGSTSAERVRTRLTVEVLETSFDPETGNIRVAGRNAEENAFVKMGAHHTLDLETHRTFDLAKPRWDSVHVRRIAEATDSGSRADVGAVVMDQGVAQICLISGHMTLVRAKVEVAIPKKRPGAVAAAGGHDKAVQRFFDAVAAAALRHIDFAAVKVVIIASPGFWREDFFAHLMDVAARGAASPAVGGDVMLAAAAAAAAANKGKFVLAHAAAGHKRALAEVLADPSVRARLADTKAAGEVAALDKFFAALRSTPERALYGYRNVRAAADRGAIEELLLSDALFRARQLATRSAYVQLVDDAGGAGAQVRLFSSLHVSGEQLSQISGVAALLRFAVPDIEEAAALVPLPAPAAGHGPLLGASSSGPGGEGGAGSGGAAGGAGGSGGGGGLGDMNRGFDTVDDSDDSSDSDASYKRGERERP
jgi:protein pelota